MHVIAPFYGWLKYYDSGEDEYSPFNGKEYNYDLYSDHIYGYYIDPGWDYMGSETLYIKLQYIDYEEGVGVIEFMGEWNDALNNDVMLLKRNIIESLNLNGINKFVLIGENILNFHGSDDSYYEEWFDEVEEGWIVAIGFQDFVLEEMSKYGLDSYINYGGNLEVINWRTMKPHLFCALVNGLIQKRLGM
ncbi:MAG: hypothetical protein OCD76_20885 [Reichenbachiella sp.]